MKKSNYKPTKRHELTPEQFNKIAHLLPGRKGTVGPNVDNHLFLNAVFWLIKAGCPWRDLTSRYGKWKAVHRRFSRWCHAGIFQKIFEMLLSSFKEDFDTIQIDSFTVKAHQHGAGSKKKAIEK